MKALTLTQPWASLVAIGAKRIETRSWRTAYNGPLAIHAAKGYPKWAKETCWRDPFDEVLRAKFGDGSWRQIDPKILPVGMVVATCRLVTCVPTAMLRDDGPIDVGGFKSELRFHMTEREREFGDYGPRRWAWLLDEINMLPEPVPAKGALSLWDWEPLQTGAASGAAEEGWS